MICAFIRLSNCFVTLWLRRSSGSSTMQSCTPNVGTFYPIIFNYERRRPFPRHSVIAYRQRWSGVYIAERRANVTGKEACKLRLYAGRSTWSKTLWLSNYLTRIRSVPATRWHDLAMRPVSRRKRLSEPETLRHKGPLLRQGVESDYFQHRGNDRDAALVQSIIAAPILSPSPLTASHMLFP